MGSDGCNLIFEISFTKVEVLLSVRSFSESVRNICRQIWEKAFAGDFWGVFNLPQILDRTSSRRRYIKTWQSIPYYGGHQVRLGIYSADESFEPLFKITEAKVLVLHLYICVRGDILNYHSNHGLREQ